MSVHDQYKDYTVLASRVPMQRMASKYHLRLWWAVGQATRLIYSKRKPLTVSILSVACLYVGGASVAQATTPLAGKTPTAANPSIISSAPENAQSPDASVKQSDDGRLTRQEILALFEREARAAYQMNKAACAELADEPKRICLAKARLQFDEDMRYAKKRADLGY